MPIQSKVVIIMILRFSIICHCNARKSKFDEQN